MGGKSCTISYLAQTQSSEMPQIPCDMSNFHPHSVFISVAFSGNKYSQHEKESPCTSTRPLSGADTKSGLPRANKKQMEHTLAKWKPAAIVQVAQRQHGDHLGLFRPSPSPQG
jgi:hypothetical protein